MHETLLDYVHLARGRGLSDAAIRANLVLAGWDPAVADAGLCAEPSLPAPPPPPATGTTRAVPTTSTAPVTSPARTAPTPSGPGPGPGPVTVVPVLGLRGVEYVIMFLAMGVAATSFGFLLHDIVSRLAGEPVDSSASGVVSSATAALIVALPLFLGLFLRLTRAELAEPGLRWDPSRRFAVQVTLVITFLLGIYRLIVYLYGLLNAGRTSAAGTDGVGTAAGITANTVHALITLSIAGGIFGYYWRDSHAGDR